MRFTIDAITRNYEDYRLQQDSSWRKIEDFSVWNTDYVTSDLEETERFKREGMAILGGETYMANANLLNFKDEYVAWIYPRVHRNRKPRKFTLKEMKDVIANGYDNNINSVVLSLEGVFGLMNLDNAGDNPRVAVRNEAFSPGGGYVGVEASEDRTFIRETYLGMLEGWLAHLKTGKLDVFVDDYSRASEKEMWAEVDSIFGQ